MVRDQSRGLLAYWVVVGQHRLEATARLTWAGTSYSKSDRCSFYNRVPWDRRRTGINAVRRHYHPDASAMVKEKVKQKVYKTNCNKSYKYLARHQDLAKLSPTAISFWTIIAASVPIHRTCFSESNQVQLSRCWSLRNPDLTRIVSKRLAEFPDPADQRQDEDQ